MKENEQQQHQQQQQKTHFELYTETFSQRGELF